MCVRARLWVGADGRTSSRTRVALLIQHATRRHIFNCASLAAPHFFRNYFTNDTIFGQKKITEHRVCVFIFPTIST